LSPPQATDLDRMVVAERHRGVSVDAGDPDDMGRVLRATAEIALRTLPRRPSGHGRTGRKGRKGVLLLCETIGASVPFSASEADAVARAKRCLSADEGETGQAREVIKCGGRWYCVVDLFNAGSFVNLASHFVAGTPGAGPSETARITANRRGDTRTLRLWLLRTIAADSLITVRSGGSAGRRVNMAVRAR
jgi:hypothetical protein